MSWKDIALDSSQSDQWLRRFHKDIGFGKMRTLDTVSLSYETDTLATNRWP